MQLSLIFLDINQSIFKIQKEQTAPFDNPAYAGGAPKFKPYMLSF